MGCWHPIIAAILEPLVIEKILNHLGLDAQPHPAGAAFGNAATRCFTMEAAERMIALPPMRHPGSDGSARAAPKPALRFLNFTHPTLDR